MKKLLLSLALVGMSAGAFAQEAEKADVEVVEEAEKKAE